MPEETSVFEDLFAEYAQLDAVLAALSPDLWARDSAASGWTIAGRIEPATRQPADPA